MSALNEQSSLDILQAKLADVNVGGRNDGEPLYELGGKGQECSSDGDDNQKQEPPDTQSRKKKRRFSDDVQIHIIPDIDVESIDDLFYSEEEVADMRHEAFLEECGITPEEFAAENI